MRKHRSIAAAAALLVFGSVAKADDIQIGAGLVISGPFAAYGTDAKAGVDLGVKEINDAGGVLGRNLTMEYEDSGGDRAKAVAIYQKFAARPEIAFALSISSAEFVALNPISQDVGLPFISIGSVIPFKDFSDCAFRINLILSNAMASVLTQLKESGINRVSIIYDQGNNQTVAEADIVKENLGQYGMELAGVESYSAGDQNFTLQLARIQETKPDLIWISGQINEGALIISQARALGLDATIIGGSGLNDEKIGQLTNGAAKGVLTFALFNANAPGAVVSDFVSKFKEANGGAAPSAYNALGYDAIKLVANAITTAGSTDRQAVCKAMGATKDFQGVNGTFNYNGSGDNQKQTPQILVYGDNGYEPLAK
ncbi:MAG: ABC transporter substrate-binding protein [Rhizobiaceae bacterium]|nr:ABC transporter substrate-binding protein [Rhizobiaceae bacterium]